MAKIIVGKRYRVLEDRPCGAYLYRGNVVKCTSVEAGDCIMVTGGWAVSAEQLEEMRSKSRKQKKARA